MEHHAVSKSAPTKPVRQQRAFEPRRLGSNGGKTMNDASNASPSKATVDGRRSKKKPVLHQQRQQSRYRLHISPIVFVLISVGSSVLPYLAGQWILQHRPGLAAKISEQGQVVLTRLVDRQEEASRRQGTSLPKILLKPGAGLVTTRYTSKVVFEPSGSVHHWQSYHEQNGTSSAGDSCIVDESKDGSHDAASAHHEPAASAPHEPMGQHLLVDFEHVDAEFLASEERLALAMVQLVEKSSLTMLSYHCHSYERIGVSCVGVLLESHVAIHSFPAFGILALDLFTCGRNNPLFPLIPYIEQLFGLPTKSQDAEPPRMVWSHKRRGFSLADEERNLADIDYHQVLGYTDFKKVQVLDEATAFQAVQIVDVHDASRETSDRILYLDGVLQSRKHGEAAYHEALVHSAMFVHPDPKRVVIIGGGEGATLREVLKHNTVEEVVMIEIDERLVEIAQEHLEEWNDCSSLVGSMSSCFADPRVTLVFSDAVAWFMNRFGNESASSVASFDVIIMDALDPSSVVEFSDLLYGNANLIEAFSRALGDKGVFAVQIGQAVDPTGTAPQFHRFVEGLVDADFASVFDYTESHGRFLAPWQFIVALKDSNMRARWFRNEAELQLDMYKRSNGLSLRFFDGATFMTYQFSSRISEEAWCRNNREECADGHGFDPYLADRKESSYRVGRSSVANGGRGVFTKEKIAKGSYLGIEECVNGIFVPPNTFEILEDFENEGSYPTRFWATVYEGYIQGYVRSNMLDPELFSPLPGKFRHRAGKTGTTYVLYASAFVRSLTMISSQGNDAAGIETCSLTFVNHGCNKTYNIGLPTHISELTVDLKTLANQTFYDDKNLPYHPYIERHFPSWGCASFKALRDIEEGEEILDNYMVFGGSKVLHDYIKELKTMCSGGIGSVSQYELEREQMSDGEATA